MRYIMREVMRYIMRDTMSCIVKEIPIMFISILFQFNLINLYFAKFGN